MLINAQIKNKLTTLITINKQSSAPQNSIFEE